MQKGVSTDASVVYMDAAPTIFEGTSYQEWPSAEELREGVKEARQGDYTRLVAIKSSVPCQEGLQTRPNSQVDQCVAHEVAKALQANTLSLDLSRQYAD